MIAKSRMVLGAVVMVLGMAACAGSQEPSDAVSKEASLEAEHENEEAGERMVIVEVNVTFGEGAIDGDGVRDAFLAMETKTREEAGCITYVSSVDIHDSKIVRIYEVWDSMDSLVPHFKTQHMADFQKALGGIETKGMTAKVYEVSRELPFPN